MSYWIAFPAIIAAPVLGGLLHGADRVIRARMQSRKGPPLLQPFLDLLKLLEKRQFIVHSYHALLALAHMIVLWVSIGMLFFNSDLLMVIYFHLLATLLLVVAGYSVRSVFSNMGATRELVASLTYEPVFVLCVIALFTQYGTFQPAGILTSANPPLYTLPFIFFALLIALPVKLKKSPFDISEAHQEIIGGVEIEFSGFYKGVLLVSKWLDYVYVYSFLYLFSGGQLGLALAIFVGVFVLLAAVDNATARVTYGEMNRITLPLVIILVVINYVVLSIQRVAI
ncbi:MAG: hypothetical protein A2Z97_00960 [Bdellovibrionales bacterium GWB1_52_6]|nr:MAG: hypothetical protein A2Z97_00960 [Bdellovibrionales bacterium GWB1_52_6]OFZ03093.1 MAG: hypothetical protein A2X97_09655 [Bdellovibrionales bacterium GWA1_52_35]HCM40421.1 EchB [Bdellovibrionales bacterium]